MTDFLYDHLESNHASSSGKYIKNIVFGGLDGIITTFSIISASFGANFEMKMIIIMGVANLIADGFSMGLGDFLSSYFENIYILSEKDKELYEYDNNKEYELKEMVELYKNEGLEEEDAKKIVDIISPSKYKDFFIRTMVKYELDLEIPDTNFKKINAKEGCVTFLSFIIFGFIPVFTYIIFYAAGDTSDRDAFITTCFITAIAMFLLGFFQAKIGKQNGFKCGLLMLFNGSVAALAAFSVGYGLESLMS